MEYLQDRHLIDVVSDFKDIVQNVTVSDIMKQLKMLLPRYYSISSSPLQVRQFTISLYNYIACLKI